MNMKQLFENNMDKIVSVISSLCWYGCSIYMMIFLFCKYYDNECSSKVEMKQYHDSPSGRYPSFTFCILANNGTHFRDEILQNKFGMTQKEYYQHLTGIRDPMNPELTKHSLSEVITKIEDFLHEFYAEDLLRKQYNKWDFTINQAQDSPFRLSYQDLELKCYTYNTEYSNSVSLRQILVKFNITKFRNLYGSSGMMFSMAHYPGQVTRNLRNYIIRLNDWNELKSENNNNQILLLFSGLTVMRRRESAVDPCDPNLIDDDAEWKKYVIKEIGCIPPYWNNNNNHYLKTEKICASKNELDSIKAYWPNADGLMQIFENYTRPCNSIEQLIFNSVESYYKMPDILKMRIQLQNNMYQEVLNTKAFGRADLWANIGGFVGIFCGLSMLQTTTYLIHAIKEFIT